MNTIDTQKTPISREERIRRLTDMIFEWVEAICVALVAVVTVFTLLFRIVGVDGTSMQTTLMHGERLILSRLSYTPQRGDIVVVRQENGAEPLIKRIIGLAGDTVEVNEETGEVLLNGTVLEEPYIHVPTSPERMEGPVTVPDGCVFIMGDNRQGGGSWDSRSFGCVQETQVAGKVVFRLFPLNRLGGIYD